MRLSCVSPYLLQLVLIWDLKSITYFNVIGFPHLSVLKPFATLSLRSGAMNLGDHTQYLYLDSLLNASIIDWSTCSCCLYPFCFHVDDLQVKITAALSRIMVCKWTRCTFGNTRRFLVRHMVLRSDLSKYWWMKSLILISKIFK